MKPEKAALTAALAVLGQLEFPQDCEEEELSHLHAELAEYDTFVQGLIADVLGGGRVNPAHLQFDTYLRQRIQQAQAKGPGAAICAAWYLKYLDALAEALECVRSYVERR